MVLHEVKDVVVSHMLLPYYMWMDIHDYFEKIKNDGNFINEWNDHYIKSTNMKGIELENKLTKMMDNSMISFMETVDDLTTHNLPYFIEINFGSRIYYHNVRKGVDFKVNLTDKIYLDMSYKYVNDTHYIGYDNRFYPFSKKTARYGFFDIKGNRRYLKVKMVLLSCGKDFYAEEKEN